MEFPIADLMDEAACYRFVVEHLHPNGLKCPRCKAASEMWGVHRRHREPVLDYQCQACGRVFNAFTQTIFHKTHRPPTELVMILRAVAQGETTLQLSHELNCSYRHLLELRHRLQANLLADSNLEPIMDPVTEADEMYQNAGEKRCFAFRSERPSPTPGQQIQRSRHMGK
jgi:transposase-like protein